MPRVEQDRPDLIITLRDSSGAPWHGMVDATVITEVELVRIGRGQCPYCPWYFMTVLEKNDPDQEAICDALDLHNDTAQVVFQPPEEDGDPYENVKAFVQEASCHPVPRSRLKKQRLF